MLRELNRFNSSRVYLSSLGRTARIFTLGSFISTSSLLPAAMPFAKKITEGVVKDEYLHLNYGQEWLKENLSTCKEELMEANKVNLPLIKKMLDEVADDASVLAMDREELMEEFMIAYQDTLMEIGLDNREIARMAMAAIV